MCCFINKGICRLSALSKNLPWKYFFFLHKSFSFIGAIALIYLKIDDPVTCIPVHLLCGVWGLLAVGLFGEKELAENSSNLDGIFKGGGPKFLGYQVLAALSLMGWSGAATAIEVSQFI